MKDQSQLAIDLLATFTQASSEDEYPAFYMVDGTRNHYSMAFWNLGKKAFSALIINKVDPKRNENIQDSANFLLQIWFENLESVRSFLLDESEKDGDFIIADSDTSGDAAWQVNDLSREGSARNMAIWLIKLNESTPLDRVSKEEYKLIYALMALYSMNDLPKLEDDLVDATSWAVETYESARDMWDYAAYFDSATGVIQALTRNAALVRHRENHELKKEALNYYSENKNRFKSRAAAAAEINKQLPVRERTIYKWLAEADKE